MSNGHVEREIKIENAKYMRVKIQKYDLEDRYDFLSIKNGNLKDEILEKVSGNGENYVTDYIEGDFLKILFTSDHSVEKWGFRIEEVEYNEEDASL